jgi:transcriptional regulator with XRE-family HTH domain
MLITPQQIRAARALLKWGQDELSTRSGVSVPAIANIENEKQHANAGTQQKIFAALSTAGIDFIDGGVRQVKNVVQVLQGDDANARLLENIFITLKDTGGEILISGLREPDNKRSKEYQNLIVHLERLQEARITERILLEEGDKNFVAPANWYRWLPKAYFSPYTFQLYANKLALINWGPPQEVIIIDSPFFAGSFRNFFNFAWDNAKVPPIS